MERIASRTLTRTGALWPQGLRPEWLLDDDRCQDAPILIPVGSIRNHQMLVEGHKEYEIVLDSLSR